MNNIERLLRERLTEQLQRSGMMFRLFSRVKTLRSIKHKIDVEADDYHSGQKKVMDVIGFRIVVYFQDDVDVLAFFFDSNKLRKRAIDERDTHTFRPQRLNLTLTLPEEFTDDFRRSLPADYAPYIDNTFEIQIRTMFSEGWHEAEHDLRYKCKEDWEGYDFFSRTLNGVLATLETAEWSMKALFHEMAYQNFKQGNYRAMLRNKMRIRLTSDNFSPAVSNFLNNHREVAHRFIETDRVVFVLSLLNHNGHINLSYDNVLFLVNRIEIGDSQLAALENEDTKIQIDRFLNS